MLYRMGCIPCVNALHWRMDLRCPASPCSKLEINSQILKVVVLIENQMLMLAFPRPFRTSSTVLYLTLRSKFTAVDNVFKDFDHGVKIVQVFVGLLFPICLLAIAFWLFIYVQTDILTRLQTFCFM